MRWIGFGLTLLIAALLLADVCFRETPDASQPAVTTPWRRTAHGWQHVHQWSIRGSAGTGSLHPLVLTAGLLLGTLLVLVVFSPRARRRPSKPTSVPDPLSRLRRSSLSNQARRNRVQMPPR